MKGIILAGGTGSRLYPTTHVVSKQLLPLYDKPMVYYPLTTLMLAGMREILVISTPDDTSRFERLLGDGVQWGLRISYATQPRPEGIAQAFLIAESYIGDGACALILGDNVFYGHDLPMLLREAAQLGRGATIFAYAVREPQRYGVVEFGSRGEVLIIEEKPQAPKSKYAVTGLYFYDSRVIGIAKTLAPSARGNLEITDLNRRYLEMGELKVKLMGRGHAWLDTDTHESLLETAQFIQTVEKRQGLKIACPEEIAFNMGYISQQQLQSLAQSLAGSGYSEYLQSLTNF